MLVCCALTACNQAEPVPAATENIIYVDGDDTAMNNAINTAKNNFGEFDKAFKSGRYDTSTFFIKVRFPAGKNGEHIWASYVTFEKGNYYGIIDDLPEMTTAVKMGDKVKITKENMSDWMYGDNAVLRGGYTTRVLRQRMSLEERKSFDSGFYLIIKDSL